MRRVMDIGFGEGDVRKKFVSMVLKFFIGKNLEFILYCDVF